MAKNISKKITKCRVCNCQLKEIISLGKSINAGYFPSNKNGDEPKLPLRVYKCENNKCELVQLGDNYNLDYLFGNNYGYRSGLNSSMVKHLKNLFIKSKKITDKPKLNILDIGSNDGTLLNFYNKKHNLFAVDPTIKKFKKFYNKNINTIPFLFDTKISNNFKKNNLEFDLIYTISMFYDLPNPNQFVKNIYKILRNDGTWVIENSYLITMLKQNSLDTICHEHIEYYSLQSISYLLNKYKLYINDFSLNKINGGSVILFISKNKSKNIKLTNFLKYERKNTDDLISNFKNKIYKIKNTVNNYIDLSLQSKNKIYIYGASTKGNTILNFFGLNYKKIPFALDVNKEKNNKLTPGSHIKILNKIDNLNDKVIFLVLIWHFKKFIINKETEMLKKGVHFLFPLPKPHLVFMKNGKIQTKYLRI